MNRNKKALRKEQIYTGYAEMTLHLEFKKSLVYAQMKKVDIDVLGYIYSRLRFSKTNANKKYKLASNNGQLKLSSVLIAKNLGWCRTTISHAIGRLVGWGLIKIEIYGGDNCAHTYKVLINANPFKPNYESVCPRDEERWRDWSEENHWNSERAKTYGNCKIGLATRYRKKLKALPKKLNRNGLDNSTDKEISNAISSNN